MLKYPVAVYIWPRIAWESVAAHQKLINDKEAYPKLGKAISAIFDVPKLKVVHILTTSDPSPALSAPVTELVMITLHEGASKSELESLVSQLGEAMAAAPASAGVFKLCWGPLAEKENVLGMVIGWENVEVRARRAVSSEHGLDSGVPYARRTGTWCRATSQLPH